jgi:hypothetical protein
MSSDDGLLGSYIMQNKIIMFYLPEDGGGMSLRNIGMELLYYIV